MDMWEDLKPIPKEADPDGLLDLILELNERMEDVCPDLKCEPIEFYAKYKRLLHKDYDPCITTFKLAFAPSPYQPITKRSLMNSVDQSKLIRKLISRRMNLQS